jgi:predicted RNase H-like HicB family nuclease
MRRDQHFTFIIRWSAPDSVFVANVPELPGCAAHGKTPRKALESAEEAVDLWIRTAKKLRRAIPKPKGRRLKFA